MPILFTQNIYLPESEYIEMACLSKNLATVFVEETINFIIIYQAIYLILMNFKQVKTRQILCDSSLNALLWQEQNSSIAMNSYSTSNVQH